MGLKRIYLLVARSLEEATSLLPLLCRCVSAALMLSHGLRRDSVLTVVFTAEEKYAVFNAMRLRSVSPDESSMSGVLRKVFRAVKESRARPHWGVRVYRGGLREACGRFKTEARLYLSKGGTDLRALDLRSVASVSFAAPLSEWPLKVEAVLRSLGYRPVSVRLLRADFAYVLVNNELDRAWLWGSSY